MTDFSSTNDVNIGNTEQIDDNPNISRADVTNHSTSDVGQIIESGDNTSDTHQINNLEQNGDIELQHLEVEDKIVRGDEEPSTPDVPDSPVDIHTYSNGKFVLYHYNQGL
jgi:hypothetical protein